MRTFFNLDSPLFTALSRLADMVILNLLFLLCSIPIVTAGASFTALCSVLIKIKDGNEGYITRSFFKSFKQNFKQSTIVWVILLAIAFILYIDHSMIAALPSGRTLIRVVVYIGVVIWLMVAFYVFPLIARFENTTKAMFKNAILVALANMPRTILILLTFAAMIIFTLYSTTTMAMALTIWMFIGFSFLAWVVVSLQRKIFQQLMPQEEEPVTDDVWTLAEEEPAPEAEEEAVIDAASEGPEKAAADASPEEPEKAAADTASEK